MVGSSSLIEVDFLSAFKYNNLEECKEKECE